MLLTITFGNGTKLDVDTIEFGQAGIGNTVDQLAKKHGGVAAMQPTAEPAVIAPSETTVPPRTRFKGLPDEIVNPFESAIDAIIDLLEMHGEFYPAMAQDELVAAAIGESNAYEWYPYQLDAESVSIGPKGASIICQLDVYLEGEQDEDKMFTPTKAIAQVEVIFGPGDQLTWEVKKCELDWTGWSDEGLEDPEEGDLDDYPDVDEA